MSHQALQQRVALLETQVDMLQTELSHLNEMLIRAGFTHGVETLKVTVEELLEETEEAVPYQEKSHYLDL